MILVLIVPGNDIAISNQQPAWERADHPALFDADQAWYDGMNWMGENTPEIPLGYYEQYDEHTDGDYDSPADDYGVMSWWDHGHWITVMAERILYANPFKQGPPPASAYLQTTNGMRANLFMDTLPSDPDTESRLHQMSYEELQNVVEGQTAQQASDDGHHIVIDDQKAGGKIPVIIQ